MLAFKSSEQQNVIAQALLSSSPPARPACHCQAAGSHAKHTRPVDDAADDKAAERGCLVAASAAAIAHAALLRVALSTEPVEQQLSTDLCIIDGSQSDICSLERHAEEMQQPMAQPPGPPPRSTDLSHVCQSLDSVTVDGKLHELPSAIREAVAALWAADSSDARLAEVSLLSILRACLRECCRYVNLPAVAHQI